MNDRRAYNLHSGGSEAVIPVQFEVSDDRFISSLLQSQQNTSKTGQVSDSDSGSESNDSMSNNESDTERLGASERVLGLINKYQVAQVAPTPLVLQWFLSKR